MQCIAMQYFFGGLDDISGSYNAFESLLWTAITLQLYSME